MQGVADAERAVHQGWRNEWMAAHEETLPALIERYNQAR